MKSNNINKRNKGNREKERERDSNKEKGKKIQIYESLKEKLVESHITLYSQRCQINGVFFGFGWNGLEKCLEVANWFKSRLTWEIFFKKSFFARKEIEETAGFEPESFSSLCSTPPLANAEEPISRRNWPVSVSSGVAWGCSTVSQWAIAPLRIKSNSNAILFENKCNTKGI